MSDIDLEIFIITNGRSTFEYTHKAIVEQTLVPKVTVIRDMKWVDALNRCVELCKTRYYMRVDDDFILHPQAVSYMWYLMCTCVKRKKKVAVLIEKLWEPWTRKVAGGVKIYNAKAVRKLGGFSVNHLGKVDKPFNKKVKKSKYSLSGDKYSVVGIHSMGTWEEQLHYEDLWSKLAKKAYKKTTHKAMKKYDKSIEHQYNLIHTFLPKYNRKHKTPFHDYIQRSQLPQD